MNSVPYPGTEFSDTNLTTALTLISDHVTQEIEPATLPNLEIRKEPGVDLENLVSVTIPETFAGPAITYILRQQNYTGRFSGNTLIITHTQDRADSLRALGQELLSRELLFLSLDQDPADWDPALAEVASEVLKRSTVFRLGPSAMGTIPSEMVAIYVLLNLPDPKSRFQQLLNDTQLAGQFYATAALYHLGETPGMPQTPVPVPTQTRGGNLIILVKPEVLFEEDILTGSFIGDVLELSTGL